MHPMQAARAKQHSWVACTGPVHSREPLAGMLEGASGRAGMLSPKQSGSQGKTVQQFPECTATCLQHELDNFRMVQSSTVDREHRRQDHVRHQQTMWSSDLFFCQRDGANWHCTQSEVYVQGMMSAPLYKFIATSMLGSMRSTALQPASSAVTYKRHCPCADKFPGVSR